MRVNVYSQEITEEVIRIEKPSEEGLYSAVQFVLRSSDRLHDDDQSAVTFWLPRSERNREMLAKAFDKAASLVRSAPPETKE